MTSLTYTLVSDGSSDRALISIIDWLLTTHLKTSGLLFVAQFADFRNDPQPPVGIKQRLQRAVEDYPCQMLFVHRDAEKAPMGKRVEEIYEAAASQVSAAVVPVVPVRMTEAWLLIEPSAIRSAAGNPNGEVPLNLPSLGELELVSDPKEVLLSALVHASEKTGRRLRQFERDLHRRKGRVAEYITDFSSLRALRAFEAFESATVAALRRLDL